MCTRASRLLVYLCNKVTLLSDELFFRGNAVPNKFIQVSTAEINEFWHAAGNNENATMHVWLHTEQITAKTLRSAITFFLCLQTPCYLTEFPIFCKANRKSGRFLLGWMYRAIHDCIECGCGLYCKAYIWFTQSWLSSESNVLDVPHNLKRSSVEGSRQGTTSTNVSEHPWQSSRASWEGVSLYSDVAQQSSSDLPREAYEFRLR